MSQPKVYKPTNELTQSNRNPWKFTKSLSPVRHRSSLAKTKGEAIAQLTTGGPSKGVVLQGKDGGIPTNIPKAKGSIIDDARPRSRSLSPRKQNNAQKHPARTKLMLPKSSAVDHSENSRQSSHCLVGAPKLTGTAGKPTQSQRLVRVLLNDNSLNVSKSTVDRAILKHTDLLKKLQHNRETTKTSIEMLETKLDICGVELEIAKNERTAMENRVKTLRWKLAKERTKSKEKLAAAAAALAAPTAAAVVRDKDVCLEQLISRSEHHQHDVSFVYIDSVPGGKGLSASGESDHTGSVESDTTPLMGHCSSTNYRNDTTNLQARINELEEEKREITDDFEETLQEAQSKISQLKNVLIACNERRRLAEGRLNELGESTNELAALSKLQPDELVSDILREKVSKATGDNAKVLAKLKAETSRNLELEAELKELNAEKQILDSRLRSLTSNHDAMEASMKELQAEKEDLDNQLKESQTALKSVQEKALSSSERCSQLEGSLANAQQRAISSEESAASLENVLGSYKNRIIELEETIKRHGDNASLIVSLNDELDAAKSVAVRLENKLSKTEQLQRRTVNSQPRHLYTPVTLNRALVAETRLVVSEIKLEECLRQLEERQSTPNIVLDAASGEVHKAGLVRERRSALRKAEAKMQEARARVFSNHTKLPRSSVKNKIAVLENTSPPEPNTSSPARPSSETIARSTQVECTVGTRSVKESEFSETEQKILLDSGAKLEIEPVEAKAQVRQASEASDLECDTDELDMPRLVGEEDDPLEETRESLMQTMEEVKKLRKKLAASEAQLNEATGKLVFLRKVVLSVVPEEHERFVCDVDREDSLKE